MPTGQPTAYRLIKIAGDNSDDGPTLRNWIWRQWDREDNPGGYSVKCYTWRGRPSRLVRDEAMYALAGVMATKPGAKVQRDIGDIVTVQEVKKRLRACSGYHQVDNNTLIRAAMDVFKHSGFFEPAEQPTEEVSSLSDVHGED